jgi:parallel beta-helix repeat protein
MLPVVFLLFSTSYGREIVADAGVIGKPGVFPLIQAALDFANDGDEILIRKGSYPESILITKAVWLKGEAGEVVTLTGNPNSPIRTVCRIKEATGCTLENLVFKPVYSEPVRTPVITINGGTVTINQCTIRNGGSVGLSVQTQSVVKMTRCAILNHPEGGAFFSGSTGEISNCRFEGNGKVGARVQGTAGRLTATDSTFANNAEHGLYLYELDAGTLTGNICEKNGFNGIYVHFGKEATLSDNRCIQNGRNGLSVEGKNLKVTVTRNLAKENQWGGIYAGQGVQGNLTGNEVIGNLNHGIVLNGTDASCRENLCQGNQRSGIRVENGDGESAEEHLPGQSGVRHRRRGHQIETGLQRKHFRKQQEGSDVCRRVADWRIDPKAGGHAAVCAGAPDAGSGRV